MSELESLFDRPNIVQPLESVVNISQGSKLTTATNQQRLRLVFERDNENTFLVTNPVAIY